LTLATDGDGLYGHLKSSTLLLTQTQFCEVPFHSFFLVNFGHKLQYLQKFNISECLLLHNGVTEISPEKSETMAFLGQNPIRCKIIVGNKCLQQVKNFKYLGCEISCENEKDLQQKVENFSQILGILNNAFKPTLVQTFSRTKIYNAQALPIPLYGSEIWTLRQKDKNR
jgi:hypothetical protein